MDLMTESEIIRLQHLLEITKKELSLCRQLIDLVFGNNCTECNCVESEGLGYCRFGEHRTATDGKSTFWPVLPNLPKEGRREDCPYTKLLNEFPRA